MRILVTGGAGYIGAILCPALLEAGHEVILLDSLMFGVQPILHFINHPRLQVVHGDVRDPRVVTPLTGRADAVVHLAAIVGYPACKKEPQVAQATNVDGHAEPRRLRKPDQKVCLRLDRSIYGSIPDYVCNEETPAPRSRSTARPRATPSRWSSTPGTASPTASPPPSASATGCGST